MYLLGEGASQNPDAGLELLSEAASRGYYDAIRALADLFAGGMHGVSADPIQAEYWAGRLRDHLSRHPDERRD